MLLSKYYFSLIIFHLITAQPQFNLYFTDWINENEDIFYHNCVQIVFLYENTYKEFENVLYCLSDFPSQFQWIIDKNLPSLKFTKLKQRNITTDQLYSWSAPIDLIEDYQIYLNTNDTLLASKSFYNCTLPRFGPHCEYELIHYSLQYPSTYDLVKGFYSLIYHVSPTLTCYMHLQCDHDALSICLQWTDICDGIVNCLNDGIDEKDCWQLEINQCNENEHRCLFGQCIPKSFYKDGSLIPDCIDTYSNVVPDQMAYICEKTGYESVFKCADKTETHKMLSSKYVELQRDNLLNIMHSNNKSLYSDNCWSAFTCLINSKQRLNSFCSKFCQSNICENLVETTCPDMIFYYDGPILFRNIYLAYHKNHSHDWTNVSLQQIYMCHNTTNYDKYFINITKIIFNNLTCLHIPKILSEKHNISNTRHDLHLTILNELYIRLYQYHRIYNYTTEIYSVVDCPSMDDEDIAFINTTEVINLLDKTHFKCQNSSKYIHPNFVQNSRCDCREELHLAYCEDENLDIAYVQNNILFQHICDGYSDLLPNLFDSENSTDETECKYWECNNIYTRCNQQWNCPTTEDEVGCQPFDSLGCSLNDRFCISYHPYQFICLSNEKIDNSHIHCPGSIDQSLCQRKVPLPIQSVTNNTFQYFYCSNQAYHLRVPQYNYLDGQNNCEHDANGSLCIVHKYLLYAKHKQSIMRMQFQLADGTDSTVMAKNNKILHALSKQTSSNIDRYQCGFGLPVRLLSIPKNASQKSTCLCPPNYYGNLCQYKNQRISLALKFQSMSDSARTLFAIVIQLIDNTTEKIIHSVEQLTFLSLIDCQTKFNVYLLYSTRPKHSNKEYAIHIDFYEKDSLKYRGSVLYPVEFPFLPVHRLAYLVRIPSNHENEKFCLNLECRHGQCIKYWNNPQNYTFCQCEQGWSGKYCQISQHCQCSSDSICLGKSANNRSICICPTNKFGSRCYLNNSFQSTCLNGSQSISDENSLILNKKFKCLCPNGFRGDQCEIMDNQLNISLENHLVQSEKHVFIHFHEVTEMRTVRLSTFRTISMETHSVLIQWSQSFHLVFLELSKKTYYLVYVQHSTSQRPMIINKTINSSDRCPNISELFNQTMLHWHLIRRIKYYHLPCQNRSLNFKCFHDEVHLCLCYDFHGKRLANCLQFDHYFKYDCFGQSECENDGQCLQDHPTCPTRSICLCKPCFYGRRCQYRTSGYGLSLDQIFGYYILPKKRFSHQLIIIKASLGLTIIFLLAGLVNGIFSLMTFENKPVKEVGCGLYLLGSSITTIILMILLASKFVILLLTQMTILTNMLFLQIQCYSLDFFIRVCLSLDQWFNASVACERALTIIQGARFNKNKSLTMAKRIICFLIIIVILTFIHDPLFRHIIIEDNENEDQYQIKRIWCIVRYGSNIEIYNSIIHTLHFLGPFLLNLISSIVLIVKKSRQQQNLHPDQSYKMIIRKQLQEYKHILIAPIVLVLLALPRLILTYIRTCMQSESDAWIYLCGYFLSFVPPMLTFVIFVLPSKFYKKHFRETVKQYRIAIRRRLYLDS